MGTYGVVQQGVVTDPRARGLFRLFGSILRASYSPIRVILE